MGVADNGDKKFQKVIEGIQYLIGDNKQLREEFVDFAKKAELDRRRSDDRFDRIMEKFEQERTRSDERFAAVLDQVKRTNRVAVEIARDIRKGQKNLAEGQREILDGLKLANRSLEAILKRMEPGSNGK